MRRSAKSTRSIAPRVSTWAFATAISKQWSEAADGVPPRLRRRRHALRYRARAGHRADPRRPPRRSDCSPLEKYLSLFPDHEQALFGQAVALQQTGKHAEAVEQYRKVLARNPRCEEALSNLVAMFLEKKDHASVRRYAEMLTRNPARFAHGHRSPRHPRLSGRRLRHRRAALPHPGRSRARPLRELVQPGRGLSQDGQLTRRRRRRTSRPPAFSPAARRPT